MRSYRLITCLICVLACPLPVADANHDTTAPSVNIKWSFQRTGFRNTTGLPQTAVSMRSNLSWPVVYGLDQGILNAYSLFPVTSRDQFPPTNWHRIGSNLTQSFFSSRPVYLQAASGAPDGFGVSVQTASNFPPYPDTVVVGNSLSGFQSPIVGAQALKFDNAGTPFTASSATLPGQQSNQKLFDVAVSDFGEVGAITQASEGSGPVTFWQQSPLLGGAWLSTVINQDGRTDSPLYGATIDLTYDSSSRPHVVGVNKISSNNSVAAFRFDIMTGVWTSSTLDSVVTNSPPIADVAAAANEHGIVGAAWVNGGVLKYAYMDTNEPTPDWIVTTVAAATPTGMPLEMAQGVGLAYDKAGLPVISFVERSNRQIWVAYDPPLLAAPVGPVGDFNGNGMVDGNDLQGWIIGMGEGSTTGDADADGDTDGADFLAWQRNLGAGGSSAAAATVPEPAATSIFLTAALVVVTMPRLRSRTIIHRK